MNKDKLLEAMRQFDNMTLSVAFVYAKNLILYGENVTEKWVTATQNASALEKAYRKGYYDALQRQAESEDKNDIKNENT